MQPMFQNSISANAQTNLTALSNNILNTNIQQIGDFDLTAAVRKVLTMTNTNIDNYDSHRAIIESVNQRPSNQLFFQKEFWNYQLMLLQTFKNVNTIEDRVLINQFNDPKIWFEYFAHNVLDLVQQHNLPIRYGW